MGKTNPLNDKDLAEFVELQKSMPETEHSWMLDISTIDKNTCDLSVKNPNTPEEAPLRTPSEILDEMVALDTETTEILDMVRELI